jgi:hypothetical protein
VKTKAASFTHNIPDNVPPVSFTKLELEQYTSASAVGGTWKFRFPQYGYLGRVVLKLTFNISGGTNGPLFEDTLPTELIRTITLKTHNKEIQKLYGPEIFARVYRLDDSERTAMITAMKGVDVTTNREAAFIPGSTYTCLIPVFLASTLAPHVNFSTRFVEDLELHVETVSSAVDLMQASPWTIGTVSMSLLSYYHNFHDNTENAIRNENYKRGVPASILQYDTITDNADGYYVDLTSGPEQKIEIKSNRLMYGLTLVLEKAASLTTMLGQQFTEPSVLPNSVELWGSGVRLWFGTPAELALTDFEDYNLSTRSERPLARGNKLHLNAHVYYMKFGFQNNELINTGSVGLQTVNNPYLLIKWPASATFARARVYVHNYAMIRIDSDTGVINKSMDV